MKELDKLLEKATTGITGHSAPDVETGLAAQRKRLRVLILGPPLDAVSGVSTHLNQLFSSELAAEFDLLHFRVGSEGRKETRFGTLLRLLQSFFQLAFRLARDRPDIVHLNATLDRKSFPRDAVYLAVSRALGHRVVFQVHGGESPADLYPGSPTLTRLISRTIRAAQSVVLLGQIQLSAFSEFAPGAHFVVIYNAVKIKPGVGLPETPVEGPLKLVFVGRLAGAKGVAECIQAAKLLKDSGRRANLTIAGSGPEEGAFKAQMKALGLEEEVTFVGPVFGSQKDRLWQDSDVFLFPSYTREGLPYALLESMAAGTVPITTRTGSQPEVVEDGVHGVFVPAKDPDALLNAIVRLDDDRDLLLEMSRQAIMRVREGYTIDRMSAEFQKLYRSLIQTGSL